MTTLSPSSRARRPAGAGRRPRLASGAIALLALVLLAVPAYAAVAGDAYALTLASRILVFALAAAGLNIALGHGGMVSMGHAMYMGLGAYAVVLMQGFGIASGWLQLLALGAVVAVVALAVGWVALRTRGIAFIMITLAFAQLFFFLFVSLKAYGGDEGMTLQQPSAFGVLTGHASALYYALLACVGAVAYGSWRMIGSRFGLVLRASRINERRVQAVGTSVLPYRLTAYVLSALVCALAGFFLVNLTGFVSPAYLAWTVSGELIVMVVLGGAGTIAGPLVGAAALLLVEEGLKSWTEYWMMVLGPLIVLMVLALRRGLWGLLASANDTDAEARP
ncbi:branched-chain amino acid ABC transporter permease [Variovorax sp. J22P271]|uniref:branched-chain amino acid ABC transporter permease n=1 Tax=Variovorax davisae TaxID=3053515 RepID=UPI002574C948|nr:branched-chain amino acid ABC transporter permease [Variovorax sp. J22P271]MDM0033781.1 branched-chain amino acid ABC transporter permease [Variovorax sp. J22P271]